jgi:hypothetical protein
MEAEKASAERAKSRRVLDIDFKSGKGSIRSAVAEDLIDFRTPSPSSEVETDKREIGKVEIINGFPKPTFVETS